MMFTLDQITSAHSLVNSGADFPPYIRELKALGVTNYIAFVSDGHIDYFGAEEYLVQATGKYEALAKAKTANIPLFKSELIAHQQGNTDYPTFIQMCAETGIEKWEVNLEKLTRTYFNIAGNEVLTEQIPT